MKSRAVLAIVVALVGLVTGSGCSSAEPRRSGADDAVSGAGQTGAGSGVGTAGTGVFAGTGGGAAAGTAGQGALTADAGASDPDAELAPDGGELAADGGGGGGAIVPSEPGYLHTQAGKILDEHGNVVQLTGISWFGMETSNYAPHGLWTRSLDSMLEQIASLGYNTLRLPFCSQLFDTGSTANGVDFSKNPTLQGVSGLALMDAVVHGAKAHGLRVILDRHRPDSGAQSPLWYTDEYSEARWIDDWKMLATHYKGDATVIGFDLHNEPHDTASWGDGNVATDWRLAAERAGNAVLAINSSLLIFVEGVEKYDGTGAWWGGNLRGAGKYPVRLDVAGRLVYSPHEYPASVFMQSWFSASDYPNNLPALWRETWGYLAEDGIAPIWIGELGTKLETMLDKQWLGALTSYIDSKGLSFAYWCVNPDSGDTGGILKDDWMSVQQAKQDVLAPILAPKL